MLKATNIFKKKEMYIYFYLYNDGKIEILQSNAETQITNT